MSAVAQIHHLRIVTNSELRTARACMRRHRLQYILRRRPRDVAEPLTFGTLTHAGHEAWRLCTGDLEERTAAAIDAVRAAAAKSQGTDEPVNEYMLATVEELLRGYAIRWADDGLTAVAVEQSFDVPLLNPETGHASRTFRIGGKFDGIVKSADTRLHVEELKTSASDIEPGSLYWEKVRALDTQVSIYIQGARASGYAVDDCLYTVIRKPGIKPLKATPEESREYKKEKSKACPECKKKSAGPAPHMVQVGDEGESRIVECADGRVITDPGGQLYANQRLTDETPEEYRLRVREDIAENPTRYYARATIVRLEHDEREHAFDMWQSAKLLHEAERSGFAPRNPDACNAMGACPYLAVCCGSASLDDDTKFRTAGTAREELATVE